MGWQEADYDSVRDRMQPGDVIAFSGKGNLSELIKWATRSVVSHVGVIIQSKILIDDEPRDGFFNQVVESAMINGFSGVSVSRLSDRLLNYDGEVWWLPLGDEVRDKLDQGRFFDFLLRQEHKPYDLPQALAAGWDFFDNMPVIQQLTKNVEDYSRFFCSELVAAALEAGGGIPALNASEVTPVDLCMFSIFRPDYFQIKGDAKSIKGFNTVAPEDWGADSF